MPDDKLQATVEVVKKVAKWLWPRVLKLWGKIPMGVKIIVGGLVVLGPLSYENVGSPETRVWATLGFWALVAYGIYRLSTDGKKAKKREAEAKLAALDTPEAREEERAEILAEVDYLLSSDANFLEVAASDLLSESARRDLIERASVAFERSSDRVSWRDMASGKGEDKADVRIGDVNDVRNSVVYGRAVGDLAPQHKQALMVAIELVRHKITEPLLLLKAIASFAFNDGETGIINTPFTDERGFDRQRRVMEEWIRAEIERSLESPQETLHFIAGLLDEVEQSNLDKIVIGKIRNAAGGGATWFTSGDIDNSIYELGPSNGLFLGLMDDGTPLHYDGEGSLFTIAGPGSGKTQSQMMTNLIMYKGPSVVLDPKGECYDSTAGYRSQQIGPVVRFDPQDWEGSAHYNPLDFVRDNPRYMGSDARKLADMLIVSTESGEGSYWEGRGRDILAALIGHIATTYPADERNMKSVMELMSLTSAGTDALIERLQNSEFDFLRKSGNQMESMEEKQFSGIIDSARKHLSVWDLGGLDPVTDRSDWHPKDFKTSEHPLTLYICVSPNDIKEYASILRVMIGQHLNYFMEVLPDNKDQPIVFFLDEMPFLGHFEPLPKASSLGRQYGIRLWMFAQNRSQIEESYDSVDTLLGNSVVQCWMDPDDKIAADLERNLGTTRGLFDGEEKPLAKAHELRGPEYKNNIIAIGRGEKPIRLNKLIAAKDPTFKKYFGLPVVNADPAIAVADTPSPAVGHDVSAEPVEESIAEPADTTQPN
ncbi:MAG: type IV secretory system conjugative DNA transfer family protein [Parvibaculaceae bacterium]|nr:type IV secretory system conjugative DNA transfer family protein [Parvibaculaceae bacterium]